MAAKLLVTGATGYIGGSVLSTLLASEDVNIKKLTFSALVRKKEHCELLEKHGVKAILFSGLDDIEAVKKAASEHDIVINTASAFHADAAAAIIEGLAERQKATGKQVHLIHTSGTSSLGNWPTSGTSTEPHVFSDHEDMHDYLVQRAEIESYGQRNTDVVVLKNGEAAGIKTYILMSPTIYGIGTGLFNRTSIQIDSFMRAAKRDGHTVVIGSGETEWDHVHIADLCALYELVLSRILKGDDLPSNRKGLYFNETGHHTWREISERVAKTGKQAGILPTDEVREITSEEAIDVLNCPAEVSVLGFASQSRSKADLARAIGWRPTRTRADFEASFAQEWDMIRAED